MIDDFLELLIGSGVTDKGGQVFNPDGLKLLRALTRLMDDMTKGITPHDLAEVLAQYLVMPAPPEAAATNVGYNVNFNIDPLSFNKLSVHGLNQFADNTKRFLNRLAEE